MSSAINCYPAVDDGVVDSFLVILFTGESRNCNIFVTEEIPLRGNKKPIRICFAFNVWLRGILGNYTQLLALT